MGVAAQRGAAAGISAATGSRAATGAGLPVGPLEELLADYGRYLSVERGLCGHTVLDAYVPAARLFLSSLDSSNGLDLARLAAADVSSFLARECPKRSVSGARDLVYALRSLLRYLHLAGLITAPLVWAVPSVADLRDRSLPRDLEPVVVRRLLASCDRRTLVGRRDFAILLLLARFGLRAGEVAAITLDDIDWRTGLLLVHGKGSREDTLPLPADVGEAIVSYLRRRPRCECRALFLRVSAPRQGLNRCTIAWVVRAACDRAGLPRVGAHRLRHAAATQMLRAGATLAEIGQVLRHREAVDVHPFTWRQRLTAARGFARYLATIDPTSEVPPTDLLPGHRHFHRRPRPERRRLLVGGTAPARRTAVMTCRVVLLRHGW